MNESDEMYGKDSITVQLIKLILDMPYDRQITLLKQLEELPASTLDISDRDDPRKTYANTVSFSVMGETYHGVSQDLSSGGMFINTEEDFQVGQTIIVTIPYSDNRSRVKIPGEIVRVEGKGIGIKFMKKTD